MVLRIKHEHEDVIAQHAREIFPIEACGVLVGRRVGGNRVVEHVKTARNILGSRYRYKIDSEELYKIFVKAEEAEKEIVGFYHSHPYSQPIFSQLDRNSAHYTDCSYLVYSNLTAVIQSFLWSGEEEEIDVVD